MRRELTERRIRIEWPEHFQLSPCRNSVNFFIRRHHNSLFNVYKFNLRLSLFVKSIRTLTATDQLLATYDRFQNELSRETDKRKTFPYTYAKMIDRVIEPGNYAPSCDITQSARIMKSCEERSRREFRG